MSQSLPFRQQVLRLAGSIGSLVRGLLHKERTALSLYGQDTV